jgi:hypothetical protein
MENPVMSLSAEDYIAIEQLYARYNFTLDLNDLDGWIETWTPDGEYVAFTSVEPKAKGHAALRAFAAQANAHPDQVGYHWNASLLIEPTEYGASGRCYLMYLRSKPGGMGEVRNALHYRDELVKQDGRWLFRRRNTAAL